MPATFDVTQAGCFVLFAGASGAKVGGVAFHTTNRDGLTELNPAPARLRAILRSLRDLDADPAAPEVWLSHHASGWTLSVFPGGLLRLESDTAREPIRELRGANLDRALELWLWLADGEVERVLEAPWQHAVD